MTIPKVSIIIPVYNGADYLCDAIDSALNQTYKNLEVIVINDGSCDNGETNRIAMSYGERIKYFSKINGGVASALNLGIEKMDGDYFSWLSHDDIYEIDKVEKEMDAILCSQSELTIVYGNYCVEDVDRQTHTVIRQEQLYDIVKLECSVFPVLVGAVAGGTVLFNKKHFDRIGYFKEELQTVQDYDFWFKLFKDQKIIFVDSELMTVRWHKKQGSRLIHEYTDERDELYSAFLVELTSREKEVFFNSKNIYYCIMMRKCMEWGLKKTFWQCVEEVKNEKSRECIEDLNRTLLGSITRDVYIFGAGRIGISLAILLEIYGVRIKGFIDNDKQKEGKKLINIMCFDLKKIKEKSANIIVAMKGNIDEVLNQLKEEGYYNINSWSSIEKKFQEISIELTVILEYINNNKKRIESIFN